MSPGLICTYEFESSATLRRFELITLRRPCTYKCIFRIETSLDDRKFKKIQKIVENILTSKANQSARRNLMRQIIEIASENKLSNVIGKMIKPMVDSNLPQLESLVPQFESDDDESETAADTLSAPTLNMSKNMTILPASCHLLNRLLRDLKSSQRDGLEKPIESHKEIKNLTSNLECFLFPFLLNKTRPKFNLLYDHCKKYTE